VLKHFSLDTAAAVAQDEFMSTQNTLIGIQEKYIETLNAGIARWSHRKDGGHASRISRGARHAAEKSLRKLGYSDDKQIAQIIQDARDMATLERNSDV
jgi:hypothetical protein